MQLSKPNSLHVFHLASRCQRNKLSTLYGVPALILIVWPQPWRRQSNLLGLMKKTGINFLEGLVRTLENVVECFKKNYIRMGDSPLRHRAFKTCSCVPHLNSESQRSFKMWMAQHCPKYDWVIAWSICFPWVVPYCCVIGICGFNQPFWKYSEKKNASALNIYRCFSRYSPNQTGQQLFVHHSLCE